MKQPTIVKILPIAVLVALVATRFVHGRAGNEVFLCDGATRCELGSGASWLFTGVTFVGPFIAVAGFFWARRLHQSGRLGPFSHRAIPDGEQIVEVLSVLAAGLITYWLVLNGPSIEFVDIGRPNTWVERLREFRAPEDLTQAERQKLSEVPSRRTWFLIGIVLGGPFMFSLGNLLGREWYGRKRRRAEQPSESQTLNLDDHDVIELTEETNGAESTSND